MKNSEFALGGRVLISLIIAAYFVWRFITREKEPLVPSDKPSLAVMYFKNNTGDESLDHWRSALSDLLITDLSQSKVVRVLSAERLFNILSSLDQIEEQRYSWDVLKDVGARGGVNSILVGNFTRADNTYRINVSLQDVGTGEVINSESVEGTGEKAFFSMVDELTRKVKEDLNIPSIKIEEDTDKDIESITTSSPEAFKLYSEGRRHHDQGDYVRSLASMQKAIKIDPDFAMAHRSMAGAYGNMGFVPLQKKAIQKAFELSYRVSERERFLIVGDYYKQREITFDKAIEAYEALLENYPDESIANTNLGVIYSAVEEWEKASELYKINIENRAEGIISYYNLANIYIAKGWFDQAEELIKNRREVFPDNEQLMMKLSLIDMQKGDYDLALGKADEVKTEGFKARLKGFIYLLKDEFEKSKEAYEIFSDSAPIKRAGLTNLYLSQGRIKDAVEQVIQKPVLREGLAILYLKQGNYDEAIKELDTIMKDAIGNGSLSWQIQILFFKGLACCGNNSIEEAEKAVIEMEERLGESLNRKAKKYLLTLRGRIELEKGNFTRAIDLFTRAIPLLHFAFDLGKDFHAIFHDFLATAYYRAGERDLAEQEYHRITRLTLSRLQDGDIYARSFYMLAKIYQEKGENATAIKNYEKFLSLWKNSDPEFSEVEDAKKSLASWK